MTIPQDYTERVYAGVLGKIIGVYLGRPFEGWDYDRIMRELGEIHYYVNDRLGSPLVVTDDDITGTFTFLQALPDHGNSHDLTAAQIGRSWLNYIIEERTILWWGGMGNSTEHTAYLRLKGGMEAPASGSIESNGTTVAEQIGAQIFIDGWAMVCPGDPEKAASLAKRAASVSHDGEAVYAAQLLAAMEALAFTEGEIGTLIDTGLRMIPKDCTISRMVNEVRSWHAAEADWHKTRARIAKVYGYAKYPGHVHIVPNHAVIMLALLYGAGDFQQSLLIANTAGWDTDCNSGNVGCLLGIKNGLRGIEEGPDWRGPVADRIYLPTAEGGRSITDAVQVAQEVTSIGYTLAGEAEPPRPKGGARFHFEQPGSVQGFTARTEPPGGSPAAIENVIGHSETGGRSLAIRYRGVATGRCAIVTTPTFIPSDATQPMHYELLATPTLYSGQMVRMRLEADAANGAAVRIVPVRTVYGAADEVETQRGPAMLLEPRGSGQIEWAMGETAGQPIVSIGVAIESDRRADGVVYLDYLGWDGTPRVDFARPAGGGTMWRRAWVNAVDHFDPRWPEAFSLSQDHGTGMIITGTREWSDYAASTVLATDLAEEFGLAARTRGLLRYYALLLSAAGEALLVKECEGRKILSRRGFPWKLGRGYEFSMRVSARRIVGAIDGEVLFEVEDTDEPLLSGGIGIVCSEGRVAANLVRVQPL